MTDDRNSPADREAAMDEASRQMVGNGDGTASIHVAEAFGHCYYAFLAGVRYGRKHTEKACVK